MEAPKLTSEISPPTRKAHELLESRLREIVAQALKNCSRQKKRGLVARELSDLTDLTITQRMVNDWASPSKRHPRLPAILVEPLARVTGTPALERAVIGPALNHLIDVGARVKQFAWVFDELHKEVEKMLASEGRHRPKGAKQHRRR